MSLGSSMKAWFKPDRLFPSSRIPAEEIKAFIELVKADPGYLDPQYMRDAYRAMGVEIIPDAFDRAVAQKIDSALTREKPFSVVRIGDGEANILAFGDNLSTPYLDRHAFENTVTKQADTFQINEMWMLILRDLLANAVYAADVVGVLGVWIPNDKPASTDKVIRYFTQSHGPMAGQWRGREFMLRWARAGSLQTKTLASAHLYFGILTYLDRLITNARKVVCISNRERAIRALREKHPDREFLTLPAGQTAGNLGQSRSTPDFLLRTENALPKDLRGCLCLVGAGPWAEIYCTWIKQRGGVGIDLGSGFDLLEGEVTRVMHRALPKEVLERLSYLDL